MTSTMSRHVTVLISAIAMGAISAFAGDFPQGKMPPRTVADITQVLTSYKPDSKKADDLRAILESQPPQTTDRKDLAQFYLKRALAAEATGAVYRRLEDYRKVVELGGAEDKVYEMDRLTQAEMDGGSSATAVEMIQHAIAIIPARRGEHISLRARLANAYLNLGDIAKAQETLLDLEATNRAFSMESWWPSYRHIYAALIEGTRARILGAQGKYVEAEAALRKAIEERTADVAMARYRRTMRMNFALEERLHVYYGEFLRSNLAQVLIPQNKLSDAEVAARQALATVGPLFGGYAMQTGVVLLPLAYILEAQGRYSEARRIGELALDIFLNSGAVEDSSPVRVTRYLLASVLTFQGQYAEALIQYRRIFDAYARFPSAQAQFAGGNLDWSLALLKTGKSDEALLMLNRLIPIRQRWLGKKHLDSATLVGVKAMALALKGDKAAALDAYREALPVLLNATISDTDEPSPLRMHRLKLILESYLALLGEIRGTPMEIATSIDAAGEAFRLADALRSQSTQSAVTASAVRAAANDPRIGGEIRREQDLAQEMVALHKILRDLMNSPADQQLPKVIADMQKRIEAIKTERAALQADIERRFPAYANLIRPQPPSLAETRAIMKPGEALINIFNTDTATYLWAFRKDGPVAFASIKLTRNELAARVQSLRKALDPGDVDLASGIPEFDLDAAHQIYIDLLAPVAQGWQGSTHLLVAANGALGQLPLAVLPTARVMVKPDSKLPYAHFKDVPWLIRQAALTQLPSVNALVALRKLPAASAERTAFVGFGDPQFAANPVQIASNTRRLRNLSVSRPSQAQVEQAKPVEWMDYGQIPQLPDTRDEILALAQALKADPSTDVFLGNQASRANVKKMDLSRRRVVAFATHGLLAGDFPGVLEPSLALANPGDGQHGLLTLEDIMSLKLDADWVVLSACNTAAGDGQGADALSGLGRGFFYAGSRALLVTHWPVESASARLLVTGLFERQAANAKLTRAEALRQSILALMQQKSADANFAYAHPLFWAPYALVGEGGN